MYIYICADIKYSQHYNYSHQIQAERQTNSRPPITFSTSAIGERLFLASAYGSCDSDSRSIATWTCFSVVSVLHLSFIVR